MGTKGWCRRWLVVVGALLLAVAWFPWQPKPRLAAAGSIGAPMCAPGERSGPAGMDDTLRTADGLPVSVRTPTDYDATRGHALLVVYPPAGFSREASERFYGLTEGATRRGYVVAYSAAVPLSRRAIAWQQRVAQTVAERWCIDLARLAFVGHSDGGSVAQGVLLRGDTASLRPQHVLASAAGIRGDDLAIERCPPPTELTIVHSTGDERFPGYGRETARWWAACFDCPAASGLDGLISANSCLDLGPCRRGGQVRFCEASEPHGSWPRVAHNPFPVLGAIEVGHVSPSLP